MGILAKFSERRDLKKVIDLERLWDYGNLERLDELLLYLKNPSSEVRGIAILAIGEYLPVIKEKKKTPEGKNAIAKAVNALLELLSTENEDNLITVGIAFGNTDKLVNFKQWTSACKGLEPSKAKLIAKGIERLDTTEYRTRLLSALQVKGG